MSTDICHAFRANFTYGQEHEDDLANQLTECCHSHLAKNPHIDSIEDVFDDANFTRVAVPIMQCQHDRVVAFESRRKQIDAICTTDANWDDMREDELLKLPNFMTGDTGKEEFQKKCKDVMQAQDKAKRTTGRKLEVTFEDAKEQIRTNMGPTGTGHWKLNLDKIGAFCEDEAKYDWGNEKSCCIRWVTEKIDFNNVRGLKKDFDNSVYTYLKNKNHAYGHFTSLQAERNTEDQSLYHQCGLG